MTVKEILIWAVVTIVLVCVGSFGFYKVGRQIERNKLLEEHVREIQRYEQEIVKTEVSYQKLQEEILEKHREVQNLKDKLSLSEDSIEQIRREYENKIKVLNSYNVSDLDTFFRNRYGTGQ